MQISFECVSFGVFCKHANLDLECILRDSCLYLFFVIIGKLVNQAFKFQSFVLSNVYQNQLRSKGISEYSLEIFHNLIKNTRKSLRSLRGQKMKSIFLKTQVINSLFCKSKSTLFMEFPLSIFRCGVCHIVCDAVAQLIGQWPRQDRKRFPPRMPRMLSESILFWLLIR